jgi:hypothetical protein
MTQSAKGIKSDAITTVIASTISNINTTISNVASNVSTLTSTVSNVASNVSTLTSAVNNVTSNISSLTTSVSMVTSGISNVQATVTTIATPKISSITYPGDDTAADPAGGQTITLNGLNFVTGATVLINNQIVSVVSVVNSTTITFTSPALAAGSYIVYVINTDGGTGISIPGIQYSGTPTWTTPAGTLGSQYETTSVNKTLVSAGDAPITYSLVSGSLPPGATFNANGTITGTSQLTSSPTTYTFTVAASDAQHQDTNRQFSITINPDAITWASPANATVITSYEYSNISNVPLTATSAIGDTVNYSGNNFPSGITISGGNISGMSNTVANTTATIIATGNTTSRTSSETVYFNVQQDVVTWSNPSANATITLDGAVYSNTLSATSAAGKSVSYSANTLPTGLSLTGNTISGTPTTSGNVTTLLTATAATTNRSATNTINWVINLGDAYWKYTSMLLSGSTPTTPFINDASLNNSQLTISGDTRQDKFSPYYGNYYSLYFNGAANDHLTMQTAAGVFDFGTGDFTFEFWYYTPSFANTGDHFDLSFDNGVWQSGVATGTSNWHFEKYGGGWAYFVVPNAAIPNAWTHIAVSRSSGTMRGFVNGVLQATASGKTENLSGSGLASVNYRPGNTSTDPIWYSNIRSVIGTAVYTANFTVPTSPLTAISGTKFLTARDNRIIDSSSYATSITTTGTPKVSSAIPFAANSSYRTYGSAYFDGTGDYLSAPASVVNNLTGTWTVEAWCYMTQAPTGNTYATSFPILTVEDGAGTISHYWGVGATAFVCMYRDSSSYDTVTGTMPSVNTWFHIAVTNVGSTVSFYINGVLAGSKTQTAGTWNSTQSTVRTNIGALYTYNYAKGYIADLRIVNGTAVYTTAFTPPTAPLTAVAGTSLLTCQYNGGANNNVFVDQSSFSNIITRNGNTTQGTFSPFSQNGWSNYFDGTGDYLNFTDNTAFQYGTGDFTIEFWLCLNKGGVQQTIFDQKAASGQAAPTLFVTSSNYLIYDVAQTTITGIVLAVGQWYHIAVSRQSTSTMLFVDGAQVGTTLFDNRTYINGTARPIIGVDGQNNANYNFNGYVSNLRIIKGTSLYNSSFTPSKTPLSVVANTSLLTCQSNRFIDNSFNGFVVTKAGDTTVQAFSPFGGVTSVPTSYSTYFDGSGDYLQMTEPSATASDITIECWVFPTVTTARGFVVSAGGNAAGAWAISIAASNVVEVWVDGYSGAKFTTTLTVADSTWNHLALVKTGGTVKIYVNGVLDAGSYTQSGNFGYPTTSSVYFGLYSISLNQLYNGYISNFRYVQGTALYSGSAITIPTSPLTAVSGTKVLACQSSTMIDSSTSNFAITAFGDAKPKSFNPFGDTTTKNVSYTPAVNGGSMFFDGNGDYLEIPHEPNQWLGSSDFTIEAWVYPTRTGEATIIDKQWQGASAAYASYNLYIESGNTFRFLGSSNGGTWDFDSGSSTAVMVPNQWWHVALTRSGSSFKLFINGVLDKTTSNSNALYNHPNALRIGAAGPGTSNGPYFQGYMSDVQVIKGTALYTSSFVPRSTPATPTTTIGSQVASAILLLNGTSGGIIDYHSSSSNVETVGNTQLASETPYAGRYYSNYFDGNGDYLVAPYNNAGQTGFAFGTGDFTVEFWTYRTTNSGNVGYLYCNTMGTGYWGIFGTSTNIVWHDQGLDRISTSITAYLNKWLHVAYVRSSGVLTLYLNGVSAGTYALTTDYSGITYNAIQVGTYQSSNFYAGYLSNVRVVKGTAVYTSNFTPSTTPLTAISGTALLTCQSNVVKDNSTNNLTIGRNGDTAVKSMNPFQQNTGKSIYFDGTGDWLQSPASSQTVAFGTGDFTVEAWIYFAANNGTYNPFVRYDGSGTFDFGYDFSSSQFKHSASSSILAITQTVVMGTWYHVALTRASGSCKIFLNGTQIGTTATGNTDNYAAGAFKVGGSSYSGSHVMNGYIADLRITKGVARYTTTFTPPATPLMTK